MQAMWQPGDALVLLLPTREDADAEALLAMLRERKLLRSAEALSEGVIPGIQELCGRAGTGCRVHLESEWLQAQGAIAATCAAHAHLAFTLIAERTRQWEAHAIGRVTETVAAIFVDGRAQIS